MKLKRIQLFENKIPRPGDGRDFDVFTSEHYSLTLNEESGIIAIVHPPTSKVRLLHISQCWAEPLIETPDPEATKPEKSKAK